MLRITKQAELERTVLRVEGKLVPPWLQELENCWRACPQTNGGNNQPLVIDLRSVTFVGVEGKRLLSRIYRSGAQFVTAGMLMNSVVEELQLHPGEEDD